ncbi:MAG TPA: hypothetical protein VF741_04055 [Candidatus Aquilonibacter sp.]
MSVRAALGLMLIAALAACAPVRELAAMQTLRNDFTDYHRCVPLGWDVEPVADTYVVGTSVEFEPNGWWLRPSWIGLVHDNEMQRKDVREAVALLDDLVSHGLVQRTHLRRIHGTEFNLTMTGMEYYFDRNRFGNNPLRESYLCYSKIVPDAIVALGRGSLIFHWHESAPASWADDPVIRSRSVVLAPLQNPVEIRTSQTSPLWLEGIANQSRNVAVDPTVWQPP